MIKILLQLTAVLTTLHATALADYGDIWITPTLGEDRPTQGRLEFKDRDGEWGTICDSGFTKHAGNVACKQLGFVRAEKVLYNQFKSSRLPITICETSCTGKESRLSQCQLKSCNESYLFQLPCKKENIVGVECTNLPALNLDDGDDDNSEVASGNGQVNEHGHPIDDEDSDDDHHDDQVIDSNDQDTDNHDQGVDNQDQDVDNHDQDDSTTDDSNVSVGDVGITDGANDDNLDLDETAQSDESQDGSQNGSQDGSQNGSQDDSKQSDDSISAGVILTIVLSCLFILAAILVVLGFVCLSCKRRHPTFIVTHDYPKILVASDTHSPTTSIPKSYMQSPRFSPKGYEALPVTDYVPVQPHINKPVY